MRAAFRNTILATAGALLFGAAIAVSSFAVSSAARVDPTKASCDTSGYCIIEKNKGSGGGVKASGSIGVYGKGAHAGGEFVSSGEYGVYGYDTGGGAAVDGVATGDGEGIYGSGEDGGFLTGAEYGAYVVGAEYPIYSSGGSSGDVFYTDNLGDGYFSGGVVAAGGFATVIRQGGSAPVSASGILAPRSTIEDTGTAQLAGGMATVRLDPTFARTLDGGAGYQVFLTPDGDTRGWLYVAEKFQRGFIVREAEHGRSTVAFDYRVVGHPAGTSDERFPTFNEERPAPPRSPTSMMQH